MGNPRGAPLRAIVLERGHRPGRPMGGGTPAVVPGTEAAQELAYVSDQVLVDLGGIHPHQPPSLSGEGSLHLLGPEPRQAVPRLDHDRGHGRVTPQGREPPTRSVQGRANLGQKAPDGEPLLGRPSGSTRHLPVQIGALIGSGHAGGHAGASPGIR